jgi:protein arginine N-methyltransferase 1
MSAARLYRENTWSRTYQPSEALLSDTQLFATLDYNIVVDTNYRKSLSFKTTRTSTVHGILMWFETELVPGVGYSNAPGAPEQVYGQAFFPLEYPIMLGEETNAVVDFSANFIEGDYVWSWAFRATDADGQVHAFRQSSFKSDIFAPEMLAPRAATFCPPRLDAQDIDIFCISRFDGHTDLSTIAEQLLIQFPRDFETKAKALQRVAKLSAKYNGP